MAPPPTDERESTRFFYLSVRAWLPIPPLAAAQSIRVNAMHAYPYKINCGLTKLISMPSLLSPSSDVLGRF